MSAKHFCGDGEAALCTMAKVASDVVDDQESNEFVTDMAPFTEKIGSKRASRLPISEPSPKRTMLDLAKERPGAITRLFREFSNKGDALTLAHVALNPGASDRVSRRLRGENTPEKPVHRGKEVVERVARILAYTRHSATGKVAFSGWCNHDCHQLCCTSVVVLHITLHFPAP